MYIKGIFIVGLLRARDLLGGMVNKKKKNHLVRSTCFINGISQKPLTEYQLKMELKWIPFNEISNSTP